MTETNSGCDNLTYLLDDVGTLVARLEADAKDARRALAVIRNKLRELIRIDETDTRLWLAEYTPAELAAAIFEAIYEHQFTDIAARTAPFQQEQSQPQGEN